MKLNVAALNRRPPCVHTRAFPLAQAPDGPLLTLHLLEMDALLAYKAGDLAEEMRQKYLVQGLPFPPFGEGSGDVVISESVIRAVCPILAAQTGPDPYSFEELVWIAATESRAWIAIQLWFEEIGTLEASDPGEPGGAPTPTA